MQPDGGYTLWSQLLMTEMGRPLSPGNENQQPPTQKEQTGNEG